MSFAYKTGVAIVCLVLLWQPASGQENVAPGASSQQAGVAIDPERLEAAKELIEVTGARKQIELMLDVMKKGAGAGANEVGNKASAKATEEAFKTFTERFGAYREQMVAEFASLYAARFTAEELRQISTFYKSGTGAKFISIMPQLMQQGAAIGQKYALMVVRELKAIEQEKKKP